MKKLISAATILSVLIGNSWAMAQTNSCQTCEDSSNLDTQWFYPSEPGDISTTIQNPYDTRIRIAIDTGSSYTVQGRRYPGGEAHIWVAPKQSVPVIIHVEQSDFDGIRLDAFQY